MSVIYCFACDLQVDTDYDLSHCEGEDCGGCECNPDCPSWTIEERQEWEDNEAWIKERVRGY